jgi:glycosyltransferase involved in cell wall biosynthesis
VAIYAKMLQDRGHDVSVVFPARSQGRGFLNRWRRAKNAPREPSHFDGKGLRLIESEPDRPVEGAHVPDGDAVIATWWETAEWVHGYPKRCGKKFYLIQHHEVHSILPRDRSSATYRLPLHKIVVARWLADVMRTEYGDRNVDVVPNSVDHAQFFAPERGKQSQPTVGLLYSTIDWKRFGVALQAAVELNRRNSEVRALCFGIERPPMPLPPFVSFQFDPPQHTLRDIYASCDVWLTASSSEGFNLPAMEAMACRTPVVATRTGWPAEAIVDGYNGACVEVDDGAALTREAERILTLTDAQWRRMSANAYETVRQSSWSASADLFERALLAQLEGAAALPA